MEKLAPFVENGVTMDSHFAINHRSGSLSRDAREPVSEYLVFFGSSFNTRPILDNSPRIKTSFYFIFSARKPPFVTTTIETMKENDTFKKKFHFQNLI